jgi:hypothetical protein
VIELKSGTRIWIAAGFTDLRRGFQGLSPMLPSHFGHHASRSANRSLAGHEKIAIVGRTLHAQ